ncbi:MAG TPA: tetratricopeptide repeat protein [Candidatus Paceibacterota bacterium]
MRILDRLAFIILQAILFFAPIFFIPSISVPLQTGRSAFFIFGTILVLVLWLIARLRDGVFEAPKTWLYPVAGALGIIYALSAISSAHPATSLMGQGFELGTLAFFGTSIVLFLLVPLIARTEERVFYSYLTLLCSFFLLALFHVIRFFAGPDTLAFGGLLGSTTSAIFGKWNDLAVFFGLTALVSLVTLERVRLSALWSVLAHIALILSLVMVALIGFSPVWTTILIFSFVFLVYELSLGRGRRAEGGVNRHPYYAGLILIVSIIFLFAGATIGDFVSARLGTAQIEVRPTWAATMEVSSATLANDALLGSGPNRFSNEWLMHKPGGVNQTLFWNTDFNYGVGFVTSFLATTGILGAIAIVIFVVLLAILIVRALISTGSSVFGRYLVLSSALATAYMWVFSIIYVPSNGLWVLTLAITGLFIAASIRDGVLSNWKISTKERSAGSFVSVLVVILILVGSLAFGYSAGKKFIASVDFQKALIAVNRDGKLEDGEAYLMKAIALDPSDVYYQSLAELYLGKISNLLNDTKISKEDAQKQFQDLLGNAIGAGQAAVAANPTNYQNYVELGRIFEAVVPLEIQGAYDSAKSTYEAALALNPQSPEIPLLLARLSVANKDNKAAKGYIDQALAKKNDYADAIFLLAQIQISENDVPNAIRSTAAVATLNPNDSGIFFQLGLLYYNQKDYQSSTLALERAVALNPEYANAKYFLGLSYYQVGAKDKALVQFKDLEKTNPDNEEVKNIVSTLEAGKPLFSEQTSSPAKRTTPPVQETTKSGE